MEIAVVGSGEFITGFQLTGIKKAYAVDKNLEGKITEVLEDEEVGILILNARDMKRLPARFRESLEDSVKPSVVALSTEKTEVGLREIIKKSIGVDLWRE